MSLDWFTNRKKCRKLFFLMVLKPWFPADAPFNLLGNGGIKSKSKKTRQIFWGRFHVIYAEASGVATHHPFMAKSLKIGPFFSPFYLLLKPNGEIFILSTVLFILFPMFMNKWSFGQFCNVPVKQQQIHFTLIVAPQLPVGENPWIDSGHFGGNPCSLMGKTMGKPVFISFNPKTWIQP